MQPSAPKSDLGPAVAPSEARREIDHVVADIWCRVLRHGTVEGDFFHLGGDAVDAAEFLSLLDDAFHVTIGMAEFLADPTIPAITAAVVRSSDDRRGNGTRDANGTGRPDRGPVAFSQEGMLWHEQWAPGSFNLPPFVRRYQGRLDTGALEGALRDVVARHAPLRTTFVVEDGRGRQHVAPRQEVALPIVDLGGHDPAAQRERVAHAVADAALRPFDLARGPLFEPHLFRLASDDHVLLVRLHHLVFDDWSVNVFRRDLSAFYRARVTGSAAGLPELRADFLDHCRQRRRALAGRTGAEDLAWWRRELAGAPLTVGLPIAYPDRPPGSPHRAVGPVRFPIPPAVVERLRGVARTERTTLYTAMLAMFAMLVGEATGQDDLVMASVVANRSTTSVEPLIGCFTKKILLRLRLAGDPTFREFLQRVRSSLLGALAHQELPYETVLQETLGRAAAAHGLVPDISIVFQAEVNHPDPLSLPGLTVGPYETPAVDQPHFAAADAGADGDAGDGPDSDGGHVWGHGLYGNTFLIASLEESAGGVALLARGAFHRPAVEAVLDRVGQLAAAIVGQPDEPLSAIMARAAVGPGRNGASTAHRRRPAGQSGNGVHPPTRSRTESSPRVDLGGYVIDPGRIASVLRRHPEVHDADVVVVGGTPEERRLVAYLGVGDAPDHRLTVAGLRSFLWSHLPGYAWPASVIIRRPLNGPRPDAREAGANGHDAPGPRAGDGAVGDVAVGDGAAPQTPTPEETTLAALWGDVLGAEHVALDANYWQRFSFTEVLRRAHAAGLGLRPEQVRRNRTVRTLAADLAAERLAASRKAHPPAGLPAAAGREQVIRADGLTKRYDGGRAAVAGIDLSLVAGEILAVLGPNGAGKTTTVGMLTGKVVPSGGRAFVKGIDVAAHPAAAKRHIGLVQQANTLDRGLNVWENLYFHARYFGMTSKQAQVATGEVIERLHLEGRERASVHTLSGGFVRRVMLARAILHRPAVLFLDEPTAGLDPQTRLALWEILGDLRSHGQTIFMTTHYMEEADQLADRVAIMDHGRILALDTPGGLKRSMGHGATVTVKAEGDMGRLASRIGMIRGAADVEAEDGGIRFRLTSADNVLVTVGAAATACSCRLTDLSLLEDTLENVFINLTGRDLRE